MKHKENCTIYTPQKYSNILLDSIGYGTTGERLFGKRILEFSSGEGSILIEILRRYIENCKFNNISESDIIVGIQKDIVAYEIDELIALKCENNINDFLSKEFQIYEVNFQVIVADFLLTDINERFDYIVGNPPYISYHALKSNPTKYSLDILRLKFKSCKSGSFDYAYPFVEKTLSMLSEEGKLSLLIPNSIFKNKSANALRKILENHIHKIYDYAKIKVFEDALIATAIIVLNKTSIERKYIDYYHNNINKKIDKNDVFKEKWVFTDEKFLGKNKFGDYFNASFSCATLCNEAFVLNEINNLELELIRPTGSPKTLKRELQEYIIFPYLINNGALARINENDLKNHYPNIYKHLLNYKDKLLNTNKDKNASWYEFGRTQGLKNFNLRKILMSPIVTNMIHTYNLEEQNIPYSGIVISQTGEHDLQLADRILTSDRFMRYIEKYGTARSGHSIQVGTSMIENYLFNLEDFIWKNLNI